MKEPKSSYSEKHKSVVIGSKNNFIKKPNLYLSVGSEKTKKGPWIRYLGVFSDGRLSFEEHFMYIAAKSSMKLGNLIKA